MKKNLLGGLAVLAIAAVAAFNVNISVQENGLSDISLENVEALAAGEGSGQGTLMGNSQGTRFCCSSGNNSCGAASC